MKMSKTIRANLASTQKVSRIVGWGFLLAVPLMLIVGLIADDHGLFVPRSVLVDLVIPKSFIYTTNEYELRCHEGYVLFGMMLFLAALGITNVAFWKNNRKKLFRYFHLIMTVGLALLFAATMIEDDIIHELKVTNRFGKEQYENKVALFYQLSLVWIILQLVYIVFFLRSRS